MARAVISPTAVAPARRLGDIDRQLSTLLVQDDLVRRDQLALIVIAFDSNRLFGGIARQADLGLEGRSTTSELRLPVDQENDLLDVLAGNQGLCTPQAENDVGLRRDDHQAVDAGDPLRNHHVALGDTDALGNRVVGIGLRRYLETHLANGAAAADLVGDPHPHQERVVGSEELIEDQGERFSALHRDLEAHVEVVEALAGTLDQSIDLHPDLGLLILMEDHEARLVGKLHQHPHQHSLPVLLGEEDLGRPGDQPRLGLRQGRRGRLPGPGCEILGALEDPHDVFVRRAVLLVAVETLDARDLIDQLRLLAQRLVEAWTLPRSLDLGDLLQPVGHLVVVQRFLAVEWQPEHIGKLRCRLVEHIPLSLRRVRVPPDFDRPEGLVATHQLASHRFTMEEEQAGSRIQIGESLEMDESASTLDRLNQFIRGGREIRILGEDLLDEASRSSVVPIIRASSTASSTSHAGPSSRKARCSSRQSRTSSVISWPTTTAGSASASTVIRRQIWGFGFNGRPLVADFSGVSGDHQRSSRQERRRAPQPPEVVTATGRGWFSTPVRWPRPALTCAFRPCVATCPRSEATPVRPPAIPSDRASSRRPRPSPTHRARSAA